MDKHTAKKLRDAQRVAAAEATTTVTPGQTESTATPAQKTEKTTRVARVAKPRDPAVVAAEAALAKAKEEAKAARVSQAKPKAEPRPTCTANKHDGTKCTAKAKQGQGTCVDHTPAWGRLSAEDRNKWTEFVMTQHAFDWANRLGWHAVKAIVAVEVGE